MHKTIYAIVLLACLFAVGCMHYGARQGTIQKADGTYLQFVGDSSEAELIIDDGHKIAVKVIEKGDQKDFDPRDLYQIKPGKHSIKVFVSGQLIVDQLIYVAGGEIKEVFLK